jgi:hypothetical protein
MAKKKDICEECQGELGEDGVCQDCGWIKTDDSVDKEVVEDEESDEESEEEEEY